MSQTGVLSRHSRNAQASLFKTTMNANAQLNVCPIKRIKKTARLCVRYYDRKTATPSPIFKQLNGCDTPVGLPKTRASN